MQIECNAWGVLVLRIAFRRSVVGVVGKNTHLLERGREKSEE